MTHPLLTTLFSAIALAAGSSGAAGASGKRSDAATDLYRAHCAGCHSDSPPNGSTEQLTRVIREGMPERGMPPFGALLSDTQVSALVALLDTGPIAGGDRAINLVVAAEHLNPEQSSGYRLLASEDNPDLRYVGYINTGDSICYDDLDLSGVGSVELQYANGGVDPGRFALLAYTADSRSPINLGEQETSPTGGWEDFQKLQVGLSFQLQGNHQLCFAGVRGSGIFNLRDFTLSDRAAGNLGTPQQFEFTDNGLTFLLPDAAVSAAGHRFRLQSVASAPGELWALDFLADGRLVATEKGGRLWLFKDGESLGPVEGVPEVWHQGQGGLLGVTAHEQWLYLTYSAPGQDGAMTAVVRGQLDGLRWINQETIYTAPDRFHTDDMQHFGSRLVARDGYIYFSIGDRGQRESAQNPQDPRGKIHRLHQDGRIPEDNPFVADESALASIWTLGHRNPQGMTVEPKTGAIWSAEHGPRGGDEVNLLRAGLNYGWPLVTHGTNYDGTPISEHSHAEGMESPRHHWTPSIAVSNMDFYTGEHFPQWRNHLLVGSLAARELRLLRIDGDKVAGEEVLLGGLGRIRDIRSGPDGYPYLLIGGEIYRLVPSG